MSVRPLQGLNWPALANFQIHHLGRCNTAVVLALCVPLAHPVQLQNTNPDHPSCTGPHCRDRGIDSGPFGCSSKEKCKVKKAVKGIPTPAFMITGTANPKGSHVHMLNKTKTFFCCVSVLC